MAQALASVEPSVLEAAEMRLDAALSSLEAKLGQISAARQVAEESRELLHKHETLRKEAAALAEENQKLKRTLQDAGLKQAALKGRAADMLKKLDTTMENLERLAS